MSIADRVREAARSAANGPLADARQRPVFPRVAALSPFPAEAGLDDYLARFRAELEALTGNIYGPFDAAGAADQVAELIAVRGEHRVLAWAADEIGCPGLVDRLAQASIELVPGNVPNDADHQRVLEELAALEIGLSGAVAALADTGSVVVASGPGRPRSASLLPPVHIAIVPLSRLYPTMHDWLIDGGADLIKATSNVVVITGSSRSSDIELRSILGMHGPRELHVVLLQR